MKKYESVSCEILMLGNEDILTASMPEYVPEDDVRDDKFVVANWSSFN